MDCLLKENLELKTKVEEGEAFRKETVELKDRIAALEEEVKTAGRSGTRPRRLLGRSILSWDFWMTLLTRHACTIRV